MSTHKDSAVSFLTLAASGRVREAYANHIGSGFRHHNPFFAAGAQALMSGMEVDAREHPNKRLDVLRALEDGDLVAVHSRVHMRPEDDAVALVHIFRFDKDQIVELWDIAQPVPSQRVNASGMF